MKRILSVVDSFTDRGGEWLALGALPIAGIIVYEVIARYVFNNPTVWAHETTALVFGVYVILAGGYCVLHERHVRIDVLWARLSPRGKAIADLATSGFALFFVGGLLWFSVPYAWHSFQIREVSETVFGPPLYPSKIILAIGASLLLLQLAVKFIRDLYTGIKRHE